MQNVRRYFNLIFHLKYSMCLDILCLSELFDRRFSNYICHRLRSAQFTWASGVIVVDRCTYVIIILTRSQSQQHRYQTNQGDSPWSPGRRRRRPRRLHPRRPNSARRTPLECSVTTTDTKRMCQHSVNEDNGQDHQ